METTLREMQQAERDEARAEAQAAEAESAADGFRKRLARLRERLTALFASQSRLHWITLLEGTDAGPCARCRASAR